MNKKWSIEEESYLKLHANDLTDGALAIKLSEITGRNVTMLSVRKKRQKLGLKKARGRGVCGLVGDFLYNEGVDHLGKI
jgi:hypothetical protein